MTTGATALRAVHAPSRGRSLALALMRLRTLIALILVFAYCGSRRMAKRASRSASGAGLPRALLNFGGFERCRLIRLCGL